jgi:hypothetical protein
VVPSEDYSHGPPAIAPLCSKATTETKQERKYAKLMKTDSNFQTNDRANHSGTQVQAQSRSEKLKQWNVLLDGEVIGSVHGQTEAQAKDTIAVFRMKNLTIEPSN